MIPKSPPNSLLGSLERLRDKASDCVKCGRCLSVCPVYKETGREAEVARGKLALIEAAALSDGSVSEAKVKDILSYCLLCGACAENCPNLVSADEIIREGRRFFSSSKNPTRSLKAVLSRILPFPNRMNLLHRLGKRIQPLLLKKIPRESGLHWRFPWGGSKNARFMPHLADEPFLRSIRKKDKPQKPAALIFVGCVSNYVFPHIAQSAHTLFEHMNLPVLVAPEQGCCGLMAFGAGEIEPARHVAMRNIEAFSGSESVPVVALCSSCSAHLKRYPDLFDDEHWKKRARQLSVRVKDLSEFLVGARCHVNEDFQTATFVRLTFHDPCHLRRSQGIIEPPRELLISIKGAEFIETGQDHLCCGSGGSFNLSHYDISLDIFRRRLSPIQEAGVDMVVTSCMGCLLQLLDGLHQEGQGVEAKHLAEVLGRTIK